MVDRIQCPPRGSCKVLSGTSIRILPASRYIFAVQRASYSICSTPKAPEQSPCSHVLAYIYIYIHIYVSCLNLTLPLYVYVCVCVYRTRNDNDVCSSLCRGYIYIYILRGRSWDTYVTSAGTPRYMSAQSVTF